MKVNYNVSAGIANNALQRNDKKLSESLGRLSSGLKITHAKDNPSGLAMSRRMNSQIEGLGVAGDTSHDAISIVQVADGSLSEIHDVLQRMNELAVKASNGTLTEDDRKTIQAEITELKDEIDRMAGTTQFNGQNLLDGSFDLRGYATIGGTTDPAIDVLSYSDGLDTGKYTVTIGQTINYSEVRSESNELRKELSVDNGGNKEYKLDSSQIQIMRVTESGQSPYMAEGLTAVLSENVLTLTDITGKEMKIEINRTFPGDGGNTIELDLTGTGAMTMQIGANEGQTLDIRMPKVDRYTLGIGNVDVVTLTQMVGGEKVFAEEEGASARAAIESIKNAIAEISSIRSRLGAYQNRLEHTTSSIDVTVENMTAAYSRIMDVDMAEEMTVYSTQQVLSQAGISMMAQANERPSQVLQLLQ